MRAYYVYARVYCEMYLCVYLITLAKVTPKGFGRWGLLVAKIPFLSFNMGGVIFAVKVYF